MRVFVAIHPPLTLSEISVEVGEFLLKRLNDRCLFTQDELDIYPAIQKHWENFTKNLIKEE